jgi:hypothetical protein
LSGRATNFQATKPVDKPKHAERAEKGDVFQHGFESLEAHQFF